MVAAVVVVVGSMAQFKFIIVIKFGLQEDDREFHQKEVSMSEINKEKKNKKKKMQLKKIHNGGPST